MIKTLCNICSKELEKPGALIFGPPEESVDSDSYARTIVPKYHICEKCYKEKIKPLLIFWERWY
jgi:hypothetical protein